MTIEEFEKAQKKYYELSDCARTLQELKQSYEIRLHISYENSNSIHIVDEEVKRMLVQYYEGKLAKLTKQFNEV